MFEGIQVITENEQAKFAVIPYAEYVRVRDLLADEEQLADYLDYLHMQRVKKADPQRHTLDEVKQTLALG